MAKIVKPAKPKRVKCDTCGATMDYMPEEIQAYNGHDYGGGPDGYKRVKCPRPGCKGYGYVERW